MIYLRDRSAFSGTGLAEGRLDSIMMKAPRYQPP